MRLTRVIKLRMQGDDVTYLQTKLKEHGFFHERIDGNFGQNTLVAVGNFQIAAGLKSDGIVGSLTWNKLQNWGRPQTEVKIEPKTIDIPNRISYEDANGLRIYDCLLSEEEYIKTETTKETIWLHHTAGGSRPDWTIGGWEKDFQKDDSGNPVLDSNGNPKPIKVGTSFVIGRKSSTTDETIWDGKILRAFEDKYWAYHLGISKYSMSLNSSSIGIEICNYGPLTQKNGQFFNYVNKPIKEKEVVELDIPFRGYKFWERYTDAQLESTRKLIIYLSNKWGIEIQKGIYTRDWFDYNEGWFSNGGLRSHTQVRKDKFDIFPQPEMIQMLNSL